MEGPAHTAYFYKCVLGRLIEEYPDLKLQPGKFFWVKASLHTYMIYDEDGYIGKPIDLLRQGGWERRIIIDRSQKFVGVSKFGFAPYQEELVNGYLRTFSGMLLQYEDPNKYAFIDVDCSTPYT